MLKYAHIRAHGYARCAVQFRATDDGPPIDPSLPVTVTVTCGAASIQTYATREECRELAEALMAFADAEVPA